MGGGVFDEDRAVGIDDDLVHLIRGQEIGEIGKIALGVAGGAASDRAGRRAVGHQKVRSRLTKTVITVPWSMRIVGGTRR